MTWIVRFFFVALLTLTAGVSDAVADCGSCGDAAHAEKGHHDKAGHADKVKDAATSCVCPKAKDGSVWCDHCGVGHHDGKKIKCQDCYKKATGETKEGLQVLCEGRWGSQRGLITFEREGFGPSRLCCPLSARPFTERFYRHQWRWSSGL